MFFRTNTFADKRRQLLNPDEWMVKLLNLAIIHEPSTRPGAVVIQIDGLSHAEFTRAIQQGEMPHLARLMKKEGYTEHVHYCGQPSNTPAVQGALFYGVGKCVPAFSFKDKKTNRVFNMFFPASAAEIENRIQKKSRPLLKDGSAYGSIFTGGAKEAHFCMSAIGWGTLLAAAKPVAISVFTLMHLHIILRSAVLIAVEFFLAIYDSVREFIAGKGLPNKVRYILLRVIACVVLREIIGVGAKIDITRGLSVIHVNFGGYDEQAHHRGPGSKFAHWTLRAIDSVIRIIWKAAKRSFRRDYEVFIYSDHGQEETIGYQEKYGRSVQAAVNDVLKQESLLLEFKSNGGYQRADLLRNKSAARFRTEGGEDSEPAAVTIALGPLGHIYPQEKLSAQQKERIARSLVAVAQIPLVLAANGRGQAIAWNAEGRFMLPRDARKVLGENHPFLRETAKDLAQLCRHENAGQVIISGFRKQGKSITFYPERGSHGGPGPRETAGFALLPPDAALHKKNIRTVDIREAIFRALKRNRRGEFAIPKAGEAPSGPVALKIMSYNIHACKGRDGKVRPERIARVIAQHNPDIIALQEIDVNDIHHQAQAIAKMLSVNFQYHSSVLLKTGQHGNAIFSRFDMKLIRRGFLPQLLRTPFLEKRGVLWVEVNVHGRKVQVLNTHLSLFPLEGMLQVRNLLGRDWLGHPACKDPVILCGDFNSLSNSRVCKALGKEFHSIHFDAPDYRHLKTFPSYFPLGLLDHIFLGPGVKAVKIETPKTQMEKSASDHLPLIAEVMISQPPRR